MNNKIDISKLAPILEDFVSGYLQDSPEDLGQWLDSKLQSAMPDHSADKIKEICSTIINTAETNTSLVDSIKNATANGQSTKSWFADQMKHFNGTLSSGELAKNISICRNSVLNAASQNIIQETEQRFSTEEVEVIDNWEDDAWNTYRIKDLAYDTADKINTLSVSTLCDDSAYGIFDALSSVGLSNLPVDVLNTTGLKAVVSGALQTAVNNNIITALPIDTPADIITNITCNSLNNLDVFSRISNGVISVVDGIENIAQNTIATVIGITLETKGMALGTAIGSVFGPVGSMVGGAVGSIVSRFVGAAIGNKISAVVHKVGNMARTAVRNIGNKIKEVGSKVFSYLFG